MEKRSLKISESTTTVNDFIAFCTITTINIDNKIHTSTPNNINDKECGSQAKVEVDNIIMNKPGPISDSCTINKSTNSRGNNNESRTINKSNNSRGNNHCKSTSSTSTSNGRNSFSSDNQSRNDSMTTTNNSANTSKNSAGNNNNNKSNNNSKSTNNSNKTIMPSIKPSKEGVGIKESNHNNTASVGSNEDMLLDWKILNYIPLNIVNALVLSNDGYLIHGNYMYFVTDNCTYFGTVGIPSYLNRSKRRSGDQQC